MAITISSSVNLTTAMASLTCNYTTTSPHTGVGVIAALYVGGDTVNYLIFTTVASGSFTIPISSAQMATAINGAYGNALTSVVEVRVSTYPSYAYTMSKYGNLSIMWRHTSFASSTANPYWVDNPGLMGYSWTKPTISGLPSDGFAATLRVYVNNTLCITRSNLTASSSSFTPLTAEITEMTNALNGYGYGDIRFELDTLFKTGSSSYSTISTSPLSISRTDGVRDTVSLTINNSVSLTDTWNSFSVSLSGKLRPTNSCTAYLRVNGVTVAQASSTSLTFSITIGTTQRDNIYTNASGSSLSGAVSLYVVEGSSLQTKTKTGGTLTISARNSSLSWSSTASPYNLDSLTVLAASWTQPHSTFRGHINVQVWNGSSYVNCIQTGLNSNSISITPDTTQLNALIGAMNEVSPRDFRLELLTQFNTGSWTTLSGSTTVTRTGGIIKIFVAKTTISTASFTISDTLTTIPYTLTIPTSGATHNITLFCNGVSVKTISGITASGNMAIDAGNRTTMLNAIPNANSATAYMTVETIWGGLSYGSNSSANVTATVSTNYQPSVSAGAPTELTTLVATELVTTGSFLQNKSRLRFATTGVPSTGATIVSYKLEVGGSVTTVTTSSASLNIDSNTVTTSGSVQAIFTITDSRGRARITSYFGINIMAYTPPKVNSFEVIRVDGSGNPDPIGTKAKFIFNLEVGSVITSATERNRLRYQIFYKLRSSSTWSSYTEVQHTGITLSSSYTPTTTFPIDSVYDVNMTIRDDFYLTSGDFVTSDTILPYGKIAMMWGDEYMSVGKVWTQGTLDVGGEIYGIKSGGSSERVAMMSDLTTIALVSAGSTTVGALQYNGTTAAGAQFYGGTTQPTGTTRLNYSGAFYPTQLNILGTADTATTATHYFVETGTDGFVRPKTLANVTSEIVTLSAVNNAFVTTSTWNPVITGGTTAGTGTYTAQAGRYIKHGTFVSFHLYVSWTAHTGTGQMRISLPTGTSTGTEYVCSITPSSLTFTGMLTASILSGESVVSLFTSASNGARAALAMDTSGTISISGCYISN